MEKKHRLKKHRLWLSFLIAVLIAASCIGMQPSVYADNNQDVARIELKINADESQILNAGAEFTAELWVYNIENVASGQIYIKGQTFEYENTSWNGDAGISENSKFSKVSAPPILAGDKIDLKLNTDAKLSAGISGVRLCTVNVKMSNDGAPSLSFGGKGIRTFECNLKDENGNAIYKKDKSTQTIMTAVSYSASSSVTQQYEVWDSSWSQFQGGVKHNAVTDIATPKGSAFQTLKWTAKLGEGYKANAGMPLLIGDYLYVTSTTELLRINKETGAIEKSCALSGSTAWNTVYQGYGIVGTGDNKKGVIFVSLAGGQIEAIEATTMTSLWVAKAENKGQNQCPILFDEETQYVYTGYWASEETEAPYICVDANTGEIVWEKLHRGGFYWAGATIIGDYLITGSDNGDDGSGGEPEKHEKDLSTLYVLNKRTGAEIDKSKTLVGDQRGTITVSDNGKIYFTTKGGYIYSALISEEGKITELKGKQPVEGQEATSTPVVYGERVYYGVGNLSGKNCFFIVADSDTLEEIYRVEMPGYPQGSPLLSTAYTEDEGMVYIYSTYNFPFGGIILIKDKSEQTSANSEELFIPDENMRQYCLSSIIPDLDGTLYYINDSGALFAVKKNDAYIKQIGIKDESGNDICLLKSKDYAGDNSFSSGYVSYYATACKDAKTAILSFDVDDDVSLKVNGVNITSSSFSVDIPEIGIKKIVIEVSKGTEKREYIISLQKASSDTSVDILGMSQGMGGQYDFSAQNPNLVKMSPELRNSNDTYSFEAVRFSDEYSITVRSTNPYANVKLKAINSDKIEDTDSILEENGFFINAKKTIGRYINNYGITDTATTRSVNFCFKPKEYIFDGFLEFVLTVVAEDGVTERDYFIKAEIDRNPPQIKGIKLTKNNENKFSLSFESDEGGELLFLIKKESEELPSSSDIKAANSANIQCGKNNIEIGSFSGNYIIYYITRDKLLNNSKINSIRLNTSEISEGNNNIGVYFRLIGSTLAKKDIDLGKDESYNEAEYVNWIPNHKWSIDRNSNVGDLFRLATEQAGIKSIGIQQNYIKTIYAPSRFGGYALSEFTNGSRSGWMYTLNGHHPNKGLLQQPLKDGDTVVWHYVNDYAYEVEDWGTLGGESYPALGDGKFYNKWLQAADIDPSSNPLAETVSAEVATAKDGKDGVTTVKTEIKKGSEKGADGASISTATVTVKDGNAAEMLRQAKENKSAEIILDAKSGEADADKVTVELPKKVAENILADTKADLTLRLTEAELKISQAALKEIASQAKSEQLAVEVERVKNPTEVQKKLTGESAELFALTVKSGDSVIHKFGAGTVTVRRLIPERLKDKKVAAVYIPEVQIPENEPLEVLSGKKVAVDKKAFYEFTTSHFSDFALLDADEAGIEVQEAMNYEEVKSAVKGLKLKVKTKALKKSVRVTVKADKETLMNLKDSGYKVRYEYYRTAKKNGKYKLIASKKSSRYTDKKVKKGKSYYYKARLAVYDDEGKLVATTSLRTCKASKRQIKKAG